MHFDSLPRMDIPADAGRIGRALEAARAAGKEPPGLYWLFAHRPAAARALARHPSGAGSDRPVF